MKVMDNLTPRFKLWLNSRDAQGAFGDGKCRLLEHIEAHESLRAASDALHISYRKAWGDVRKAQSVLGIALVERQRGGRRGGQTVLTEQGRRWLGAYHRFRQEVEAAVQASFERFAAEVA
jgi:molybdate transport system regulatory protein